MDALILAAGDGTRMGASVPKVLLKINGTTLLEHHINVLKKIGVKRIYVVVGYKKDMVENFIREKGFKDVYIIYNPDWEKGNAYSVVAGSGHLKEPFILVMGDHYYDGDPLVPLKRLKSEFVMVVDSRPAYVDLDEATKVKHVHGRVVAIGKGIKDYNAVDTGIFLLSPAMFPFIKRCIENGATTWNDIKREWIKYNILPLYDIEGALWYDLDTPEDVENLKAIIQREIVVKKRDGIISRTINRAISSRISSLLVKTPITPNQITLISFFLALIAAGLFSTGIRFFVAIAGLLTQFSSIIDGCDGEIARLKGLSSKYGAWLDSVLDRWADGAIIMGMAWGYYNRTGVNIWPLALFTLMGCLILSYTESRYESLFKRPLFLQREIPAKRDVRLFLFMLGGIFNVIPQVLVLTGILGFAESFRRLLVLQPEGSS